MKNELPDQPVFYAHYTDDSVVVLPEDESIHSVRVLRMRVGDELLLIDGKGNRCNARIIDPNPKHCCVEIFHRYEREPELPYKLNIAIAPVKNADRFEWFLEKVTEIGISRITPLLCDRSERKKINADRSEKILVSAMKQSHKAYLPVLEPVISFKEFIKSDGSDIKSIAHCLQGQKQTLADIYIQGKSISILIGPEGDFSPDEIKIATECGYIPVTFGNSRLRTETAGLVACHSVQLICQLSRTLSIGL